MKSETKPTLNDLETELTAEVANKLTYPRTVLAKQDTAEARKAVRYIDQALESIKKWFKEFKNPD